MFKYFSIIRDWLEPSYNLIAQPPPGYDPGDTAQREGMYAFAIALLYSLDKCSKEEYEFTKVRYGEVLNKLDDPNYPGFIRRYPNILYWGGQSDRLSRDQAIPNVVAMGFLNKFRLDNFFRAHFKYRALLFTTNTRKNGAWPPGDYRYNEKDYKWKLPDLTILSFWGLYIRAYEYKPLYPLLYFFDLEILLSTLVKCFWYGRDRTNKDDLNHIIELLQSKVRMPTFISRTAFWVYKKFRPYPYDSLNATNSAQACLNAYFKNPTNPGPKLDEIYQEITQYFFEE